MGRGRGFTGSHRSEEQKHAAPALPFACGEREGAKRLLDAFELEDSPQSLDPVGRAESRP